MKLVVLDCETYYDREYSLSKITTEDYVRSPQFELIGFAIKPNDGPTQWVPKPECEAFLKSFDWSDAMVVCQNTAFDGAILDWRYGVKPLVWADTLGMSRALYPHDKAHSLKAQAERMGVGIKGDEVLNAIGKRHADFYDAELARYASYCINDVELTYDIFMKYMAMGFPKQELKLIDLTLRMFIEPVLELDPALLRDHLETVKENKLALLETVRDNMLKDADPEYVHAIYTEGMAGIKKLLMSNDKFAKALESLGIDPPTKISPATKKTAWAFAKTDDAFKALEDHEDERVQALVAARLGNKTTLEETRTERFIGMSGRGRFPVPLRYYGAHSGRWSGQDSVNLQNLPSRGANAGKIKKAIRAPEGYVVIDCDSAQIEARVLAWLAGQDELVQAFRDKQDVYRLMAAKIYGIPTEEVTSGAGSQRQVGKTTVLGCFGPDTVVLTQRGWVPIIHVHATDMVWDGLRWVAHAGVVPQGEKDVWTHQGISATSDHEILTEHGWETWSAVIANPSLWKSARHVANLLSLSGGHINRLGGGASAGTLFANVHAGGPELSCGRTLSKVVALGAILAPKLRRILNGIGSMKALVQTKVRGRGYLTASRRAYPDATTLTASPTLTTAGVEYTSTSSGEPTDSRSLHTCSPSTGMTSRVWNWIGLTWTKDTSRAIFASWGVQPTWQIAAASETYKRGSQPLKQRMLTYDIAYAGPRNRYTILSADGPLVVHNCGYGVGHVKLQAFLKTQAGVVVSLDEAKRIIDTYRSSAYKIADFWRSAGDALTSLLTGQTMQVDTVGLIRAVPGKGLTLPSGLHIQYPNLRAISNEETGKRELVYTSKGLPVRIYGGKCLAADTQVLTHRGWVPIASVQLEDQVWDGVEWVQHGGLTYQGEKHTIVVDGVRMTPDHQVLTEKEWQSASSCEGLRRAEIRLPDGLALHGDRRPTVAVEVPMPVRGLRNTGSHRHGEVRKAWGAPLMRVQNGHKEPDACNVQTPRILGVAVDARSVPAAIASGVAQLRRSWDTGMSAVGEVVRGILGRHGAGVSTGADAGSPGQQRALHPEELPMGAYGNASGQSEGVVASGPQGGTCGNGYFEIDSRFSLAPEPVYDLINAGPRTRFMVRGHAEPFVVHNCVENVCQAVARQVVAEQMLRVSKRYKVVLTVHDAVAIIAKREEAAEAQAYLEECMNWNPKWAVGLPLACESGMGESYGDC